MRLCTSKYSQCYQEPQQQQLTLDSNWLSIPTDTQTATVSQADKYKYLCHISTQKPCVSPELKYCAAQRKPLPTPSSAFSVRACPVHCSFVGKEMATVKHFPCTFIEQATPPLKLPSVLSYPMDTQGKGREQTRGGCGGHTQEESSPTPIWQKR